MPVVTDYSVATGLHSIIYGAHRPLNAYFLSEAPEVVMGLTAHTKESDVYSFGRLIFWVSY